MSALNLPINALAADFEQAMGTSPVVVTAPTGSGKSTQVPRWCAARGRVLVVQPRRVACRALAARVASLEDTPLGDRVGYVVRDEQAVSPSTGIVFATTGVALRWVRSGEADRFATVILDELHERSLDLDLLFALLAKQAQDRLVAMSATLDGDRVATHLGGVHLAGEGRAFPVEIQHPEGAPPVPELHQLGARVRSALRAAPSEGDVLVFLPGKGEIQSVVSELAGLRDLEVLPLHGGLTLTDQARVFQATDRRKVIVATNVAETSLTVPGIRVVIDSGLERRTRYHQGRGVLTLSPVAQDAADQRAGRAGRTAPGVAIRLWRQGNPLQATTPPAIHRESLVPLVLAAAACRSADLDLPWLDPPKDHAVEAARNTLHGLGALDDTHQLTDVGAALFGLPLDPAPARLLVAARAKGPDALADAIDLVAALSLRRPLFRGRPNDPEDDLKRPNPWPPHRLEGLDPEEDGGCDAVALVRAVREGEPRRHQLDHAALKEARQAARRLRQAMEVPEGEPYFDRRRLADLLLEVWPGVAHVARRRKRHVAFSNGGTELSLSRQSAVDEEKVDAVLVLDVRAVARHRLEQQLWCTAAMPVPLAWLREAGLGRDRLAGVTLEAGEAVAQLERVYAGRVLDRRTDEPTGALAREAVKTLFLRGSLFDVATARDRHEARSLWAKLHDEPLPPPLEAWVEAQLASLGVESGADVVLLSAEDLLPEALAEADRAKLDRNFPRQLDLGDAKYRIDYHPARQLMELHKVSGKRKSLPPRHYLPKIPGWRIEVVDKNVRRKL